MNDLYCRIENSCIDYIAMSEVDSDSTSVLFPGVYKGTKVLWEATIVVCDGPQYIELSEGQRPSNKAILKITVGLNVNRISGTVILKTIKMVRQYRNLQPGKYEYKGINK